MFHLTYLIILFGVGSREAKGGIKKIVIFVLCISDTIYILILSQIFWGGVWGYGIQERIQTQIPPAFHPHFYQMNTEKYGCSY